MGAHWLIAPVVLGIVVAGVAWLFDSHLAHDAAPEATTQQVAAGFVFAEAQVVTAGQAPAARLHVGADGPVLDGACPKPSDDRLPWSTCHRAENAPLLYRSQGVSFADPLPDDVRVAGSQASKVGPGHWLVNATLYVFTDAGELLASNAPAADQARFPKSGDHAVISGGPWYLGNATPPPGTETLPAWGRGLAAGAVAGLTEGGIATRYSESHPYAWATGPLWVTVRVDEVLAAE